MIDVQAHIHRAGQRAERRAMSRWLAIANDPRRRERANRLWRFWAHEPELSAMSREELIARRRAATTAAERSRYNRELLRFVGGVRMSPREEQIAQAIRDRLVRRLRNAWVKPRPSGLGYEVGRRVYRGVRLHRFWSRKAACGESITTSAGRLTCSLLVGHEGKHIDQTKPGLNSWSQEIVDAIMRVMK